MAKLMVPGCPGGMSLGCHSQAFGGSRLGAELQAFLGQRPRTWANIQSALTRYQGLLDTHTGDAQCVTESLRCWRQGACAWNPPSTHGQRRLPITAPLAPSEPWGLTENSPRRRPCPSGFSRQWRWICACPLTDPVTVGPICDWGCFRRWSQPCAVVPGSRQAWALV